MRQKLDETIIRIKGQAPRYAYAHSLSHVFQALGERVFSTAGFLALLQANGIALDEPKLLRALFGYRHSGDPQGAGGSPFTFAGPFQMRSVLGSMFPYNLRYQDAVIKIELEKNEADEHIQRTEGERNEFLRVVLEIVAMALRTSFFNEQPVYLELTNMELDRLVLQCLFLFGLKKPQNLNHQELIATGNTANQLAGLVQQKILSYTPLDLKTILPYLIFSGVLWWSDVEIIRQFTLSRDKVVAQLREQLDGLAGNPLGIDDFPLFQVELIQSPTVRNVLYFLDDNGELVWGLLFVRYLLDANPHLKITCVVNRIPVTNNSNLATVMHYLQTSGSFLNLLRDERFCIFAESNELPAVDLRFISAQLSGHIASADAILVNGVSFFEKLQYLPVPAYYLFSVYSDVSRLLTGFERYTGVFVRAAPSCGAFGPIREAETGPECSRTLKDSHSFEPASDSPVCLHRKPQPASD